MRTSKEAEALDIEGYWRDAAKLPPLPEYLYWAVKGYGIRDMALYRLKCLGEVNSEAFPRRVSDRWRAVKDVCLWKGAEYRPYPKEVPGKVYTYAKIGMDVTLDAALQRLHVYAAEHQKRLGYNLEDVARQEAEIARARADVTERLAEAVGFSLTASDLKV